MIWKSAKESKEKAREATTRKGCSQQKVAKFIEKHIKELEEENTMIYKNPVELCSYYIVQA